MEPRRAGERDSRYRLGVAWLEGIGTKPSKAKALALRFRLRPMRAPGQGAAALRLCHRHGIGGSGERNAVSQFRDAKRLGNPIGRFDLAVMLEDGRGIDRDLDAARQNYREAAIAGEKRAAVNLGLMYLSGAGGAVDLAEALRWTKLAADAGLAAGQNNLGRMYELGLGVPADLDQPALYAAAAQGLCARQGKPARPAADQPSSPCSGGSPSPPPRRRADAPTRRTRGG